MSENINFSWLALLCLQLNHSLPVDQSQMILSDDLYLCSLVPVKRQFKDDISFIKSDNKLNNIRIIFCWLYFVCTEFRVDYSPLNYDILMYICILKARKKDITKFKKQVCILYQFTVEIWLKTTFSKSNIQRDINVAILPHYITDS
jgi:hypothetical protein